MIDVRSEIANPGAIPIDHRGLLFVAPSAYLLSGLATWLDYLVPALSQRGWRTHLGLVSGRKHHLPERYLEAHPCTNVLVAHCDTDTPVGRRIAMERLLLRTKPDIAVSVNIPDLFVAINQLRRKSGCSARAVMSVHGIERYLYSDMQRFLGMLDGVVCTNRLACALAVKLGTVLPDRVEYAPCGVHPVSFAVGKKGDERLRIVYSGRLETPQKRVLDVAAVVLELKKRGVPYRLEIAGDGPDREQLEHALRAEISQGNVIMHGYVSADTLRTEIYASAHALLVTSSWETGPIVAWEAMAHGICVVSSRYVGSGLEGALVNGESALLFDIGDVSGAVEALARLWTDPALRTTLQRGAYRLIEERYSIEASTNAWERAFRRILERPTLSGAALPLIDCNGRLDRWIGVELAERMRQVFGATSALASDPGGEWPHAHANATSDEVFWSVARKMDIEPMSGQAQ